ncbi:putative ribose-phosphate diphosphokinase [Medicago truncatula]|uniref:ribose-phosphate diphosphokinase n=1 Tax=Medicago truncatula TaxID=3880 RepID=G7JYZ5_MEDTR|nr:ribose-phosphate pyrophosphokinase 4 [Medicago truncatula]AES96105.1 ribose-phosphate pyrophosphokinase [Medicago truncatula]RHN54992.1 putative ribose-phosphate diphosphokinase [Medicago truncatula]
MAVMPLPPPFPATSTKLLKLPTLSHSSLFRSNFITKCEIRSFENHRNWTIEHFSNMNNNNNNNNNNNSSFSSSLVSASSASQHAMKNSKKVVLFYSAETKSLAYNIASESDAIELRSISWGKFPDGFPNIFIPNAQGIRGQHVAFLASFSSPAVIFEQIPVIYALPKLFVASFTLVLPFFPTGTSERMEDEGDIATAFTLARLLSNIPISRGGPTSLVTFDIHALQERFYFGDNILPCFESGIPLLKRRLQDLPDSDNISIAFPDDGAWKRFHKQLQHFPTVVCAKVREGDKRIVRIKEGEPKGRHIVIVDDLVQSGGTLIECQKVLAAHGASKISAYVTHGIFPNKSWERFGHDNGGNPETAFSYFWITDSCPLTVKEVMHKPPFEVLSLASSISASLQI